jgi:cytochrome c-type biogenesis protein CcmH/NrfF
MGEVASRRLKQANRMRVSEIFCLTLGILLLAAWTAGAAPAQEESWGYPLAHELMSPYCPGRSLAACTSSEAAELRQWILLQEAAGASREEVIAILEQRFGDVIRSSPEAEGWGLAAWLLPGVALVVGALVVMGVLRRMVAKPAPAPAPVSPSPGSEADADLARMVDQELAAGDG